METKSNSEIILQSKIESTAQTVLDLSNNLHNRYPILKLIVEELKKAIPGFEDNRISTNGFDQLVVSRFETMQLILERVLNIQENSQIVELGAGFTTHSLALKQSVPEFNISRYIEVDLPYNSKVKAGIYNSLELASPNLIPGDILDQQTWTKLESRLDNSLPIIIFCEGVIAHYFSRAQKLQVCQYLKEVMEKNPNVIFIIDDTLKNHPEFDTNELIMAGKSSISTKSGNKNYQNPELPFVSTDWETALGCNYIQTPYIFEPSIIDFALQSFRMTVLSNNSNILNSISN